MESFLSWICYSDVIGVFCAVGFFGFLVGRYVIFKLHIGRNAGLEEAPLLSRGIDNTG